MNFADAIKEALHGKEIYMPILTTGGSDYVRLHFNEQGQLVWPDGKSHLLPSNAFTTSTWQLYRAQTYNFSAAMKFMKDGKKVRRQEWQDMGDNDIIQLNKKGGIVNQRRRYVSLSGWDIFAEDWTLAY